MKAHGINWQIWLGFILCFFALVSYPIIFADLSLTRNAPWISFVFFAAAFIFVLIGVRRAFGSGRGKLSKVSASVLALLSGVFFALFIFAAFIMATWLPKSAGAPQIGQRAHEFFLADTNGKQVSLSGLLSDKKGVILVFYRGYW